MQEDFGWLKPYCGSPVAELSLLLCTVAQYTALCEEKDVGKSGSRLPTSLPSLSAPAFLAVSSFHLQLETRSLWDPHGKAQGLGTVQSLDCFLASPSFRWNLVLQPHHFF